MSEPLLEIRDLHASYDHAEVLRGISLRATPGQFWGVLGPNAAGKTTLLRCVAGILKPSRGEIRLMGKPRERIKARDFARACSLLLDEITPSSLEVRDYVLLARSLLKPAFSPLNQDDLAAGEQALRQVGLWDVKGARLEELSRGQLQRARIARVLAQGSRVLILDEPTAHLDPGHGFLIMGILRDLARGGKTVLAVLHSLALAARYTDHVLVVDDGRPVAAGPTSETLGPHLIKKVFGVKAAPIPGGGMDIAPLQD